MSLDPRGIYYGIDGQRYGPVEVGVIRDMIASGRLGPEHHVWDPDLDDWVSVQRYPALLDPPSDEHRDEPPLEPAPRELTWATDHGDNPQYASFFARAAAYILDAFVMVIPTMLWISQAEGWFGLDLSTMLQLDYQPTDAESAQLRQFMYVSQVVVFVMQGIYHAVMESSEWQATFGKRALGLVVTGEATERIGFGRALLRHFARIFCEFTFLLGYLMMLFSARGQGLHDRVAKTLVIKRS